MFNKKLSAVVLSAACAALLSTGVFAGPSAKFAATWTTVPMLESIATTDGDNPVLVDSNTGFTIATIKVPEGKELLVGVSAEIGLMTDTSIKGKDGGAAKAIADADAFVTVFAVPVVDGIDGNGIPAAPGQVMLSKRVQELSATLGGVIQSCEDGDLDGKIIIKDDCVVTDEEIGLMLRTTAAHHFNFVLPNMPQGEYHVKAVFTTGARANVQICEEVDLDACALYVDGGTAEAIANAAAIINKTMVTVQQVRATNSLADFEIVE